MLVLQKDFFMVDFFCSLKVCMLVKSIFRVIGNIFPDKVTGDIFLYFSAL